MALEALKAQAVAARSYAFHKIKMSSKNALFHIESSERHQVSGSLKMKAPEPPWRQQ